MNLTPINVQGIKKTETAYQLDDGRKLAVRIARHADDLTEVHLFISARFIDDDANTIDSAPGRFLGIRKAGIIAGVPIQDTIQKYIHEEAERLMAYVAAKEVWEQIPEDD